MLSINCGGDIHYILLLIVEVQHAAVDLGLSQTNDLIEMSLHKLAPDH